MLCQALTNILNMFVDPKGGAGSVSCGRNCREGRQGPQERTVYIQGGGAGAVHCDGVR